MKSVTSALHKLPSATTPVTLKALRSLMQVQTNAVFQNMEEVNDYLSRNTIECLICGKHYQALHIHIIRRHNMQADDYRRRFGIPFTRGLISATAFAKRSAAVTPQAMAALKRHVANRTGPFNLGPHDKGRVPAVVDVFRQSKPYANRAKRIIIACANCGGPLETSLSHASKPLRCSQCISPVAARDRALYLLHKSEVRPKPLTPAELAKFSQPFQTMDEVKDYLSGDTIACLICGKQNLSLPKHLYAAHDISPSEYRRQFGIPLSFALMAAPTRAIYATSMSAASLERFIRVSQEMRWRRIHNIAKPRVSTGRPPCVVNQWRKISEKARMAFSCKQVTISCPKCGKDVVTTALRATKPVHCLDCTSPATRDSRLRKMRKKQAA